jgi:hypothetical protein
MKHDLLTEIYSNHTGKATDKWEIYLREYNRLFAEYRDYSVRLLEIGIQNGGSLEIWSKYFDDNSFIVGNDINNDCKKLKYENPKISFVIGDANSKETYANIIEKSNLYDIIIDDGSHKSSDIIKSFVLYFSHLSENGIYVVEDLHCSYWKDYEGGIYDPHSSMSFFKLLTDIINYNHWGVQNKRKSDIIKYIIDEHQLLIDETQLSQVHSVEFINSMCVIRKKSAAMNVLGKRIIAGVDDTVISLSGYSSKSVKGIVPDQSSNPMSIYSIQSRLEMAEERLNESRKTIKSLQSSYSWKITKPLRGIYDIWYSLYNRMTGGFSIKL